MRDGESIDGSVNQHDLPVVAGFPEERRVHSYPFIHTVVDGVGEGGPCRVAPRSSRHVVDAHFPFGRGAHLAIDKIQREHLAG